MHTIPIPTGRGLSTPKASSPSSRARALYRLMTLLPSNTLLVRRRCRFMLVLLLLLLVVVVLVVVEEEVKAEKEVGGCGYRCDGGG